MDGTFTGLTTRAAHGFAINRDHAHGHTGQRRDPGDEAALELLRIEGGEDVADGVPSRNGRNRRSRQANWVKQSLIKLARN